MSNQNPYLWLNHVYRIMNMQSDKIARMENEITALKALIQTIQDTPKQSIGSIEYKFDQLKVENLNGTLVIGLRHGESGEIEDMWVADKHAENVPVGQPPNGNDTRTASPSDGDSDTIRKSIYDYIRQDVADALQAQANKESVHLDAASLQSIIEDMNRQAGERIEIYRQQGGDGAAIARKIQRDLLVSVNSYLEYVRNRPEQTTDSSEAL